MADLTGRNADETVPDIATWGSGNVLETGEGVVKVDLDNKASLSAATDDVDITGGSIDGTPVGDTTPSDVTSKNAVNVPSYRWGGAGNNADDTWRDVADWGGGNLNGGAAILVMLSNHTGTTQGKIGVYAIRVERNNSGVQVRTVYTDWNSGDFSARVNDEKLQFRVFDSGTGTNTACRISVLNGHPNIKFNL